MRFWNMATVMALKPGTRPLQQILFDTADGVTPPPASSPPAAARPGQKHAAEPISGGTPARAGSRN
jgi:hypothetical protein